MNFNLGDIYWVLFPYEEKEDEKLRPGIVVDVSGDSLEILTIKVTSEMKYEGEDFVVKIKKWINAGLTKESLALVRKTRVLKKDRFGKYIGKLDEEDLINVIEQLYLLDKEGHDFGEAK